MGEKIAFKLLQGVEITPLKQIFHEKGNVFHAMKASEKSFFEFGEAYFSSINYGDIKGWKKHTKMKMNIIVPVGSVKFYFYNEDVGKSNNVLVNSQNYCRLTVEPGVWMAFEGITKEMNLLLNIASIEHDPDEAINVPLTTFELR